MERTVEAKSADVGDVKNVWDTRLPDNLPEEIKCKFCEQPKQLLRVNRYIAFWVHRDIELFRKCRILTFRASFIKNVMKTFKEVQDRNMILRGMHGRTDDFQDYLKEVKKRDSENPRST